MRPNGKVSKDGRKISITAFNKLANSRVAGNKHPVTSLCTRLVDISYVLGDTVI